jgi:ribosomal-protein-alanine N-acetyltransferase
MSVRESTPEDLPHLLAIRAASLVARAPRLLEYGVTGPALALTAETDGTPVGYALTVRDPDARRATLLELAVAPAHRRAGLGTALLEATVARLDGYERLELTTLAADDRARAFYRENGFTLVEKRPGHYERGDGVLLACSLGPD